MPLKQSKSNKINTKGKWASNYFQSMYCVAVFTKIKVSRLREKLTKKQNATGKVKQGTILRGDVYKEVLKER